ncbi:hypothetical protein D7X99_33640, partial [Corallococcus sp. AB032C]
MRSAYQPDPLLPEEPELLPVFQPPPLLPPLLPLLPPLLRPLPLLPLLPPPLLPPGGVLQPPLLLPLPLLPLLPLLLLPLLLLPRLLSLSSSRLLLAGVSQPPLLRLLSLSLSLSLSRALLEGAALLPRPQLEPLGGRAPVPVPPGGALRPWLTGAGAGAG